MGAYKMMMVSNTQLFSEAARDTRPVSTTKMEQGALQLAIKRYPFRFAELQIECPPDWIEPEWFLPVCQRIFELESLESNWDSYGAGPISPRALGETILLLIEVLPSSAPTPSIAPLSTGGVQIEWHERGIDIEIEVGDRGPSAFFFHDHRTGYEADESVQGDLANLIEALRKFLTRR